MEPAPTLTREGVSVLPLRWARLRAWARWRAWFAVGLLLSPVAVALALDVGRRGERMLEFAPLQRAAYAASTLEALLVWAVLLVAASRRRGAGRWVARGLFVLFSTLALAGQAYFYEQYNAYLNVDVSRFASDFTDSVVGQLWADAGNYLAVLLPALIFGVGVVWLGRHVVRPRRWMARAATWCGPALLVSSFFIPTQHRNAQAAHPDALYLHAAGGLLQTQLGLTDESDQLRPRPRASLPVPSLQAAPARARNVLFVILESARADAVCVDPAAPCETTPATHAAFPHRVPLHQVRALDSSTAISLAVLWTGVGPHESREVLHTWPLIFDYARAANYHTAFWTSQNMMFGNSRLWVQNLNVDSFFSATDLDPAADIDLGAPEQRFAERALAELEQLDEPFLAVVQLSNGHYPYYVDPDGPQPFQPAGQSKDPAEHTQFRNHYQNALYQQDQHLARFLVGLRATAAGQRTVIVYTSDHAEAFREHNQLGHTFSVYDEEVKVPAWIDAPQGTLTERERARLEAKSEAFLTHPDLTSTVLDLLGVWRLPALAPFKARILGQSLLGDTLEERALPMTNCAGVWSCAFENWGYIQGSRKLSARAWDKAWGCYDLVADPQEQRSLGPAGCASLVKRAEQTFGRLPGRRDD